MTIDCNFVTFDQSFGQNAYQWFGELQIIFGGKTGEPSHTVLMFYFG